MLTTAQRRAHYDAFVTQVIDLCTDNGIRADLVSGRCRPVEDCDRMQPHLIRHAAGFGARHAHYTIASLIAMHRHLAHHSPYTPELVHDTADTCVDAAGRGTTALPSETPAHRPTCASTPAQNPTAGEEATTRLWRARPNLGASLAIAVTRHGFKESRINDRLKTLTKLSAPLLHPRLWTLASHLHNHDAARLDFAVLLEDLAWWEHDQRHTATRWRESYFLTLDALSADKDHE